MNTHQKVIVLLLLASLGACRRAYYVPATHNVPLFEEKNELQLSGNLCVGEAEDNISGFVGQAAYSLTDKWALMANTVWVSGGSESPNNEWGKGTHIDAAFGYYHAQAKKLVLELYGGLGMSRQQHYYISEDSQGNTLVGDARINLYKIFIQPNIGFKSKHFEAALALPFSRLDFYGLSGNLNAYETEREVLEGLAQAGGIYLFEPSFTLRFGSEITKVQIQYLYSSPLDAPRERFVRRRLSIGLQVALPIRKKQE